MTQQTLATLRINGKSEAGLKNSINVRDLPTFIIDEPERLGGSNAGPNPLEYFLGALSACTSIMIAYVAKEQHFSYQQVEYETEGDIDTRGFKGVEGVKTYFQTVKLRVVLETEESDSVIEQLKTTVEKRCPLYNLLKDAGVEIKATWVRK